PDPRAANRTFRRGGSARDVAQRAAPRSGQPAPTSSEPRSRDTAAGRGRRAANSANWRSNSGQSIGPEPGGDSGGGGRRRPPPPPPPPSDSPSVSSAPPRPVPRSHAPTRRTPNAPVTATGSHMTTQRGITARA